jgi:hypothetical protein
MFGENKVMRNAITAVLFFVALSACNTANNQHPSAQYEEKKTSLKEIEHDSPLKFLKVTGDFHGNLVNQTVVTGEITNSATLVSYKDIQLQIIFKDKDGAVIEKQKQVVDDVIKPNSKDDFKIKTGHIKDAYTVSVDISDAVADK